MPAIKIRILTIEEWDDLMKITHQQHYPLERYVFLGI